MKHAAICIATYKRNDGLMKLLDALRRQDAPDGWSISIRVVNNDPDADHAAFERLVSSVVPDAGTAYENRRNIAHARNTAIDMGRADAYLFIDDDEIPAAGWLSALLERLDDPSVDAVFGPVLGIPAEGTARWLVRSGCFDKLGPRHDDTIDWTGTRTSSTAVRGVWFTDRCFRFDAGYGTSGGSDVEFFRRMQGAGARFVHERRGLVYEEIEADRCNWRAVLVRRYRAGVVLGRMQRDDDRPRRWARAVKRCAHGAVIAAAGLPALALGRPGTCFFGVCRAAVGIGAWRGHNPATTVTRYPAQTPSLRDIAHTGRAA